MTKRITGIIVTTAAVAVLVPTAQAGTPNGLEWSGLRPGGLEWSGTRPGGLEWSGLRPGGLEWSSLRPLRVSKHAAGS